MLGRLTAQRVMEGVYHPHAPEGSHGMFVPNDWLGHSYLTRIAGMTAVVTMPQSRHEGRGGLRPPRFESLDVTRLRPVDGKVAFTRYVPTEDEPAPGPADRAWARGSERQFPSDRNNASALSTGDGLTPADQVLAGGGSRVPMLTVA